MPEKETISKYKMYSDAPINDAESFNFKAYSDAILKIILNKENKTPFSIMINGKWGRGKTTLMRTIREKLEKLGTESGKKNNRKVKSVWFDAWKYSETDSLLAALVLEIFEEMDRDGVINKLKSIYAGSQMEINFHTFMKFVIMVGKGIIPFGDVVQLPEFESWLKDPAYKTKLSFYDIFQDYMKNILMAFVLEEDGEQYNDSAGVLVIFIDDLDRCPPKQITKVLESINLFFDQEGCFFIIGADLFLISKAIEFQYKDLNGFSGIDYIKKMIQLQFDLPAINKIDMINFVEEELQIEKELTKYFELITTGLEGNQREIKRFVNSLNLMRTLGESIEHEGYKEELLIKWSILSFYSKGFHEEVTKNPEFLIDVQEISMLESDVRAKHLKMLSEKSRIFCSKFIKDETIMNIIKSGEYRFEQATIEIYIFLSSVVPKEPEGTTETEIGPNRYLKGVNWKDCNRAGQNLQEVILEEANLEGTNFEGTNLEKANLKNANLEKANLREANLKKANLQGTNLQGVNLEGAILYLADLKEAKFDEVSLKTILKSVNWKYATFDSDIKKKLETEYLQLQGII